MTDECHSDRILDSHSWLERMSQKASTRPRRTLLNPSPAARDRAFLFLSGREVEGLAIVCFGTKRTCRSCRSMSASGGKPEKHTLFLSLTAFDPSGHSEAFTRLAYRP